MSFVSFLIFGYIENLRMPLKRNAGVPFGGVWMRSGLVGFSFPPAYRKVAGDSDLSLSWNRRHFGGGASKAAKGTPKERAKRGFSLSPSSPCERKSVTTPSPYTLLLLGIGVEMDLSPAGLFPPRHSLLHILLLPDPTSLATTLSKMYSGAKKAAASCSYSYSTLGNGFHRFRPFL